MADVFCSRCRSLIQARVDGPQKLAFAWRVARVFLLESFFGIVTGMLVIFPISAASSGAMPLLEVIGGVALTAVFIAPLVASIHTWIAQPFVQRAAVWGWISTARALFLALVMLCAVIGGGRYATFPKPVFLLGLGAVAWLLGVGIAHWQERYLTPFAQWRAQCRAWNWRGWTLACGVHFVVSMLITRLSFRLVPFVVALRFLVLQSR